MSYQHERDEFISRMAREGLDLDVTRRLLRAATTMQRYAELACSNEAADKDRVHCPAEARRKGPCLCDVDPAHRVLGEHETVPRIRVHEWNLEQRMKVLLEGGGAPTGWTLNTQDDPRGYVLRVIPPSYAERNKGRDRFNVDTIGVPSGPTGLRF